MNSAVNQFLAFVSLERHRHSKRLYMASVVAALIAVLLYETQWLNLRYGLWVLLAGQVGDVLALLARNVQLSHDLKAHVLEKADFSAWFEREERFVKRLAFFDTACQMIGLLALGYSFWLSTHTLWLSLAIGFVYPATVYVGITRGKNLAAVRELRLKKQEVLQGDSEESHR